MKTKNSYFSKTLVILMAIMMVFTMMPSMAFADVGAGNEISVTFTYSKENALVYGPTSLNVHAGQAAEYGIGTASSSPTVLDAVVAAHKAKYGDAFTAESAENYVNNTLSKLFQDAGYAGHILNGRYSSDYASQAELKNGDVVDTFLYHSAWNDNYVAFYENENIVREIQTTTSDMIELTVKSFNIMNAYSGETWEIRPAISLGTTDGNGNFTSKGIATDETGKATLAFDTEGTYILTANGGNTSIVPPWCKITVMKGMTEEEQRQCVADDKAALNVTYTDGDSVNLPTSGESGKTSITWTSSNEQVVTPKGAVIKMTKAESVTLTATIKCGSVTETKEFVLNIPDLDEAGITDRLEKGKSALLQVNALDPVEYTGLSGGSYAYESEIKDTNIVAKAQELVTAAAPGVTVSIVEVASGTEYIQSDGSIVYASQNGTAEVKFKLSLGDKSVDVSAAGIAVPKHKTSKAEAVKKLMDATTEEVVLNGQNAKEVKSTLKMPVGSTYGLAITWTSDNAAIEITRGTSSSTGQLHKITRPALGEPDAEVTLTATFDYADMAKTYGMCDGGPMPQDNVKTFKVTVPAITRDEADAIKKEVQEAVESVEANGITTYDAAGKTDSKLPADLQKVITDLHLYDFDSKNTYWKNGVRLSWTSTNPAIIVNGLRGKVTRPVGSENAEGLLTVTATKEGITASKSFDVVVLSTETATLNADALIAIEKITDRYAKQSKDWWGDTSYTTGTWWQTAVMGAYREQFGKDKLNDEQKQALVDKSIASLAENIVKVGKDDASETKTVNLIVNDVNLLSALGYDVENLTTINRSHIKAGSAINKLNLDGAKKGYFSTIAPYTLIALQQGNYGTKTVKDNLVSYLLSLQNSEGGWGYSGRFDADTTAMILQGLATQRSNPEVEKAVQSGISQLAQNYAAKTKNTYGNVNTDAVVILALTACGIDPSQDARFVKESGSLVDGVLTYLNTNKDAFKLGTKDNEMATQQAVLALLAANKICGTNTVVNVVDFSGVTKVSAVAASAGSTTTPSRPTEGTDIQVTVSIKDTKEYWLKSKSVTLKEGSTVSHALQDAVSGTNLTQTGAESGYVSTMSKDGVSLGEFDGGPNSGWLYKVNNVLPDISVSAYELKDGDSILFYYTNDWEKDPDAGKALGAGGTVEEVKSVTSDTKAGTTTAPTEVKVTEKTNADGTKTKVADVKVSAENQKEILKQAKANKSKEIILNVSKSAVGDAAKADVTLDKSFIDSIVKDTNAKLTIKTPFGEKTYTQDELKTMSEAAAGSTVTIAVEKADEPTADDTAKAEKIAKAKAGVKKAAAKARSSKLKNGNIKIVFNPDAKTKAFIEEMKAQGFTVKYRFYRSTKKSASYKSAITKKVASYTNTSGKKGTKYFYKVQVRVYDENGKLVAKTALKQCKYASRTWTK